MTLVASLLAFLAAAGLLTLTPGVDTAMVLRAATVEGRRPAVMAAFGIAIGCLIWGAAVALGLAAMIAAAPAAYLALKWAGAGYLLYLGVRLFLTPRRALAPDGAAAPGRRGSDLDALRRGLLTNLLNPKIGVFYVSFLPQFVPSGLNVSAYSFLLACIHVAMSLAWFAVLIAATAPIGRFMTRPGVVTAMDRLTGCVFVAFGARLALARR